MADHEAYQPEKQGKPDYGSRFNEIAEGLAEDEQLGAVSDLDYAHVKPTDHIPVEYNGEQKSRLEIAKDHDVVFRASGINLMPPDTLETKQDIQHTLVLPGVLIDEILRAIKLEEGTPENERSFKKDQRIAFDNFLGELFTFSKGPYFDDEEVATRIKEYFDNRLVVIQYGRNEDHNEAGMPIRDQEVYLLPEDVPLVDNTVLS